MATPTLNEEAFREILTEALSSLRAIGKSALARVLDEYAPKFAAIASAGSSEEAQEMYDDLMVNVKIAARIAGIRAETAAAKALIAALRVAAGFAMTAVA